MQRSTKIALIVVGAVVLVVAIALILYFTLRPKTVSQNTPVRSDSEKPSGKKFGGWTEQDLSNPQTLADARALAVIATNSIQDKPNFQFKFTKPTIDVTDLTSQVVNGTNYRLEYSIEDDEGDHVLFVTAIMFRPLQAPITQTQVIKTDYAFENVNRLDKNQPVTSLDKNSGMAKSTTQQRQNSTVRRRTGGGA